MSDPEWMKEASEKRLPEEFVARLASSDGVSEEEKAKIVAAISTAADLEIPDISSPEPSEALLTEAEFFVGRRYRPHGRKSRSGATFEIVEHSKETQHLAFDAEVKARAERKGLKAPTPSFYVCSLRGTVGWVPWVGSVIAWPWEVAWEADLVEHGAPDPKPERKK